jgi:hypothetical protein
VNHLSGVFSFSENMPSCISLRSRVLQILQHNTKKPYLKRSLARQKHYTARQELHPRDLKKQKRTTRGTLDDQQTTAQDQGGEKPAGTRAGVFS